MNNLEKITEISNLFEELKGQFEEMGQLKSNFDIEKFTIAKEGKFLTHQFHFLMRQYSLALSELKRMWIERERQQRKLNKLVDSKEEDADLDALETQRQIDDLDITMQNKIKMCDYFEVCRKELIKKHGGKEFTNEEFQREMPEYWAWFMKKLALQEFNERQTGIKAGTFEVIQQIEEPALLNPNFQVKMLDDLGKVPLLDYAKEINERLGNQERLSAINNDLNLLK
jgi:hypothetical protein